MSLDTCPVCSVPWGYRQLCESQSCPCFGTRCGSVEMEVAASRSMADSDPADDFTPGGRSWRERELINIAIEHS